MLDARVLEAVAPFITNAYHFLIEWGTAPIPIPPDAQPYVERYAAYAKALPAAERHLVLHEGHLIYAREDEKEFLVPAMAEVAANIGTPDELVARIHALEKAGLSHYAIQVSNDPEREIREFAGEVMKRY